MLKWDIDRLFTVTVDNASSNDVAIDYVKKKTKERDSSILGGEFMHIVVTYLEFDSAKWVEVHS